jgi:AcrR family transcriptional regulator
MATSKRLGTQKSATRAALVDAAERLILEEGYAGLTTRRLADASGIKFQLIYYYFNTLEDLLLEVVERDSERQLERMQRALDSDQPVRAVWGYNRNPEHSTGVIGELAVLAREHQRVRAAIAANAERLREMEVEVLTRHLHDRGIELSISPLDLAMLLVSAARTLRMEDGYGMTLGHADLEALVEGWLERIESARPGERVTLV